MQRPGGALMGFYLTWRDVSRSCGFGERVCGEQ